MREQPAGLFVSTAAHALLLLFMSVSLMSSPPPATLRQLVIEATVVDERALQRAQEEWKLQVRLEEQRREEQRRQVAVAEQRRVEQAEQERLQRIRLEEEAQQQAEAELQRKEERERENRARIEQERQAEEQRRQQVEEARLRAEREAELRMAIQAEERLMVAEQAGLLAQYIAVIRQKVERNWVRPASADAGLECIVHVTQIPGGEVVGVRLGECNGDAVVVRSIEAAVYRSSPLPFPPNPELFQRNLRFTFKTEQ